MKHEVLILLSLATSVVQANGMFPYASKSVFDHNHLNSSEVISEKLVRNDKPVVYQAEQQQNKLDYPLQPHGYSSSRPVQYPLFYYLPEIKEAKLSVAYTGKVLEFFDINDILDQKSEQAIKRNNSNKEFHFITSTSDELHSEVNLSGSDLSEITTSSLILSARKKQLLETMIPSLLNNQRLFLQDRERLQQLFDDFKNSKKITAGDEIWLQRLSEEYYIPKFQPIRNRIDDGLGTVSQIKKEYPDYTGR